MGENSAVQILLDKINDLTRRIEILEARVSPTYTSCTSIPITATHSSYGSIGATSTISRAEAVAYRNTWEDRLADIERQLDNLNAPHQFIPEDAEVAPMTFEVRDGNIYMQTVDNDGFVD